MPNNKRRSSNTFLESETSFEHSKFVILPVPFEKTTSYVKGTAKGPKSILKASKYLEEFDEELLFDPSEYGIFTLPDTQLNETSGLVNEILAKGKVPIIIGGEHSISPIIVRSCKNFFPDLSVLQIDAHADLRDSFQGNKFSHACAMRRIVEICPAVQVGIRSISKEGYLFAKESDQIKKIHFAHQMNDNSIKQIISQLSSNVYITIDVDGLDPSIIPTTGTPEPGGLSWHKLLDILKSICKTKNVIGFDLVEFSPIKGLHAPDYAAARLIYKMITYISGLNK